MTHERQHWRRDWACDVEVEWAGARHPGRTRNVSLGGLYIVMTDPPPLGAHATIHVPLPGLPDPCALLAVVRWSQIGEGFGAQFESLRAVEVWALNRLLRGLAPVE